jgi:hypothetical protein
MYLDNKYTRWYFNIISNAKSRNHITRKEAILQLGYVEKHHILPQSLGGDNNLENLVFLTAKEHLICHLLLTKMTSGPNKEKMAAAAWKMISNISSNQQRYLIGTRTYERVKREMSLSKKGKSTWNKGISPTHETKVLLRNRVLEYNHSIGRITDDDLRIAKSLPLGEKIPRKSRASKIPRKIGYKFTKSVTPNRICCIHCHKDIPVANFANSHGDKCKLKNTL